jgi:hypothetical protein
MSIVFSRYRMQILIKKRGRFSTKNKGGIAMFKQESITKSHWIHAIWKPWLFGVLSVVCLLLMGMLTKIMADDSSAKEGFAEVMDINLQAGCPSMQGLPEDLKDVKGFNHTAHAKEYLKGNASLAAVQYDGNFTCAACHPGTSSQDEISGEPVCDRLSGALAAAGGPQNLKKYYHETCLGCHKNMHKAEKATGPVKCKGCHTE